MRALTILLAVAPLATGCTQTRAWRYEAVSTPSDAHGTSAARVAVLPFEDVRGGDLKDLTLLTLLPVIGMVGPLERERPEGHGGYIMSGGFQCNPTHDLARAFVDELSAGVVVEEAFFTEREREPAIDYTLHGTLHEFAYDGLLYGYGVSVLFPYLHILGLPVGSAKNRLHINIEMRDQEGRVVWSGSEFSQESEPTYLSFYYNADEEFARFPELMQAASAIWVEELRQFFSGDQVPEARSPTTSEATRR